MRNRAEFRRAAAKRQALRAAGRFSQPDGPAARVAVLMPFVSGLVQDPRDGLESFERDADALVSHIVAHGREPVLRLRATVADFEDVLTDSSISTVVVRGFGNLSAISTPVGAGDDSAYCSLEWLHLSRMADHLKLGRFVARSCGGATRIFNVPLGYGVASSHRDIWAPVGYVISVEGLEDPANELIRPVTDKDELTREDILSLFPLQRLRPVPGYVPDALYVGARAVHSLFNDPYADLPRPQRLGKA